MNPKIAIICTALCVFSTLFIFVFVNLGKWLIVSDPLPDRLDILFTFAWEHERVKYSKILSEKYPNATLLYSDPAMQYEKWYKKAGIDTSRMVIIDSCKNTFEEVKALKQWIKINQDTVSVKHAQFLEAGIDGLKEFGNENAVFYDVKEVLS